MEARAHPDLLEAALTFEDLRIMFEESEIDPEAGSGGPDEAGFIPHAAAEGALYPVDGGMVACMKSVCTVDDTQMMHFSGMDEIESVLASLGDIEAGGTVPPEAPVGKDNGQNLNCGVPARQTALFLELLSCSGGCINGPMTRKSPGTLTKRIAVLGNTPREKTRLPRKSTMEIAEQFTPMDARQTGYREDEIRQILRQTGKYTSEDELNCGGCGYSNCRSFAGAVLAGKAETPMCVTYMRQLASKKANKLLTAMPSGVVIVDRSLRIIECNFRFALLAGDDSVQIYVDNDGLTGANLEKVLPVGNLFSHVLERGEEIVGKDIRIGDRVVRCSVFSIETGTIVGGIFSDVTSPELKKDEIIERAQSVIEKNLTTVQQIAYLLGENASETEMVLSTIINSFKPGTIGEDRSGGN
jgi:hypothetical protein